MTKIGHISSLMAYIQVTFIFTHCGISMMMVHHIWNGDVRIKCVILTVSNIIVRDDSAWLEDGLPLLRFLRFLAALSQETEFMSKDSEYEKHQHHDLLNGSHVYTHTWLPV